MSLSQSLEYLTSLSVPLTIGEACVFLENNLVVGTILELYRQLNAMKISAIAYLTIAESCIGSGI